MIFGLSGWMKNFFPRLLYFIVPALLVGSGFYIAKFQNGKNEDRLSKMGENLNTFSLLPPPNLNFAGETVPLEEEEVRERFDQELIRNVYYHSSTIMTMKRLGRWREPITRILKENKIPEDFIYLCVAESQLTNANSWRGARGFWQFIEETGKNFGLEINNQVDQRYDPIRSTHAACRYLKSAHSKFGNWTLVAASYNMGMNGVEMALTKQKMKSYYDLHLNRETSAYLFRILALKAVIENQGMYGFEVGEADMYPPLKFKIVKVKANITDLVQFALDNGTNYKMLKAFNPWLLKDELIVAKGKEYRIKIPQDQGEDFPELESDIPHDSAEAVQAGGSVTGENKGGKEEKN